MKEMKNMCVLKDSMKILPKYSVKIKDTELTNPIKKQIVKMI